MLYQNDRNGLDQRVRVYEKTLKEKVGALIA